MNKITESLSSVNIAAHSVHIGNGCMTAVLLHIEEGFKRDVAVSVTVDLLKQYTDLHGHLIPTVTFLPAGVESTPALLSRIPVLPMKEKYMPNYSHAQNKNHSATMHSFVLDVFRDMYKANLVRTIDSLPWRDDKFMRSRVDVLAQLAIDDFAVGKHYPFLNGCTDSILVSPLVFITQMDYDFIQAEVTKILGRKSDSLLEFYETVYHIVYNNEKQGGMASYTLFECVFRTCWEDMLLTSS